VSNAVAAGDYLRPLLDLSLFFSELLHNQLLTSLLFLHGVENGLVGRTLFMVPKSRILSMPRHRMKNVISLFSVEFSAWRERAGASARPVSHFMFACVIIKQDTNLKLAIASNFFF
jgi:hypothetical protein